MQEVAHTLPFLIRSRDDMALADRCLGSLARSCPQARVVLYNQGLLSNEELGRYLAKFDLRADVLGEGLNVGIAQGRKACFDHIWSRYEGIKYISEIHVDMVFPSLWVEGLLHFLDVYAEEPMVCPGILTAQGELHADTKDRVAITDIPVDDLERMDRLLHRLTYNKILEGFAHPVLHRAEVLRAVGGYDTRFLRGKQGYEDDSLLLGYRYYLGTKTDWKPKCCLWVRVYHATLAQRITMADMTASFQTNLRGLFFQYGVKGLMELSAIYRDNNHFRRVADELLEQLK